MAADALEQEVGGRMLGEEHGRGPDREGKEQVGAGGVAEEELGDRQGDVVLAVAQGLPGVAVGGVGERPVGLDHRLGQTRGAAREEPDRRVVRTRGDGLERLPTVPGQSLEGGVPVGIAIHHEKPGLPLGRCQRRLEALPHRAVHHRAGGVTVVEKRRQVPRRAARVDHHHHSADAQRAEEGADEPGAVGQGDEHPLLRAHADFEQSATEAVGQRQHLGVGHLAVGEAQSDPVPAPLPDPVVQEVVGDIEPLGKLHSDRALTHQSRERRADRLAHRDAGAKAPRARRVAPADQAVDFAGLFVETKAERVDDADPERPLGLDPQPRAADVYEADLHGRGFDRQLVNRLAHLVAALPAASPPPPDADSPHVGQPQAT